MRRILLCSTLCLCACKKPEDKGIGSSGEGALILKAIDGARTEADKNSTVTLNLVATHAGIGPAKGLKVDVAFASAELGTLLDSGTLQTDDKGFLAIRYQTPDTSNATVMIRAKTEGAPTLNFTVVVAPDVVKLDWAGRKPHFMKKDTPDQLTVIATNQRGAPVSDVEVSVELVGASSYGAAFQDDPKNWTDGSGMTQFTFAPGSALATYQVKAHAPKINDASLELIVVNELPDVGNTCEFSSDCAADKICVSGVCLSGSRRCRSNQDCPSGYSCNKDYACVGGCAGPLCTAPPGADLDVTGRWRTSSTFSFKESLGAFKGLGGVLGDADTILQGKLPDNIPIFGAILEAMLEALIKAYLPDWVAKLSSALNDVWQATDEVHVGGRMDLRQQAPGSKVLLGEETWELFEIKIPSFCPRRQADPAWPRCAKVNIQLGGSLGGGTTAKATTQPFVGVIEGKTVTFTKRQATVELKKLLANLVDLIGNIASNGRAKTIEQAVPLIINCEGIKSAADNLACDLTGGSTCTLPWFVPACKGIATGLAYLLGAWVETVPINWELKDFSESCQARDTSTPPNIRADVLEGGKIIGNTNLFSDKLMTGTFSGTRSF